MHPKPALTDYLHLHFLVLIWGFTAILGLLLEPLAAPAVVVYRTGMATLGLGAVLLISRQSLSVPPSDRLRLLGTGVLLGLHWLAFFGAARLANASVCLAGMATSSLWASLLEPLILRRRVRGLEVIMGAVVMAGLYLIFRFEFDKVAGLLVAIFSAMLSSLFTVINSRFTQRLPALVISFYELAGAFLTSLILLGLYLWNEGQTADMLIPQRPMQWLWLLLLAGVCTVYAYTAGVQLLRKFSPYLAVLTVNLEPVYGIMLAVLIFGKSENMTPGFYAGTLVILIAVLAYPFLTNRFTKPQPV